MTEISVFFNLAHAMGKKLIALLNNIEEKEKTVTQMSLFEPKRKYEIKTHDNNPEDA